MPPTLICPENFSVPMLDDDDIAIVKIFPPPNVTGKSMQIYFTIQKEIRPKFLNLKTQSFIFSFQQQTIPMIISLIG